jgi:hypothetical protein
MKKLIGRSELQGKGVHWRDINMRNINLNSRFGFELEGVLLDDITVGGKHQDVVRMALFKSLGLKFFFAPSDHDRPPR